MNFKVEIFMIRQVKRIITILILYFVGLFSISIYYGVSILNIFDYNAFIIIGVFVFVSLLMSIREKSLIAIRLFESILGAGLIGSIVGIAVIIKNYGYPGSLGPGISMVLSSLSYSLFLSYFIVEPVMVGVKKIIPNYIHYKNKHILTCVLLIIIVASTIMMALRALYWDVDIVVLIIDIISILSLVVGSIVISNNGGALIEQLLIIHRLSVGDNRDNRENSFMVKQLLKRIIAASMIVAANKIAIQIIASDGEATVLSILSTSLLPLIFGLAFVMILYIHCSSLILTRKDYYSNTE